MECFDWSRNLLSLAFVDKQNKADSTLLSIQHGKMWRLWGNQRPSCSRFSNFFGTGVAVVTLLAIWPKSHMGKESTHTRGAGGQAPCCTIGLSRFVNHLEHENLGFSQIASF
jgi:hypothetical protein